MRRVAKQGLSSTVEKMYQTLHLSIHIYLLRLGFQCIYVYVSLLFSFEAAAVFEQEKLCRQKAWGPLIFLLVVSDSSNASQS